jgi:hypothetical protein
VSFISYVLIDWNQPLQSQNFKTFKLTKWEALNLNKKFSMNGETKKYVRLELGSTLGNLKEKN